MENVKVTMITGWRKYFTWTFWKMNLLFWNRPTFEVLAVCTIELPDEDANHGR